MWKQPALGRQLPVTPDGSLRYPLAGTWTCRAAPWPRPAALTDKLREQLREVIVSVPSVVAPRELAAAARRPLEFNGNLLLTPADPRPGSRAERDPGVNWLQSGPRHRIEVNVSIEAIQGLSSGFEAQQTLDAATLHASAAVRSSATSSLAYAGIRASPRARRTACRWRRSDTAWDVSVIDTGLDTLTGGRLLRLSPGCRKASC